MRACSFRIAVGRVVILFVIIFFFLAFVFVILFVLVWLLAKEDIGENRVIRSG
jgi:hypothetical protein